DVGDPGAAIGIVVHPVRAAGHCGADTRARRAGLQYFESGESPGRGVARIRVVEPAELQRVAIRVACLGGQLERVARAYLEMNRPGTPSLIDHDGGRVIRSAEFFHGPVHARREVVLKSLAPAPHRGLVGQVAPAVDAGHFIARGDAGIRIAALRPEGPRLTARQEPEVAATPATPTRIAVGLEAIADEVQERRRVALHDVFEFRVGRAQRTFGTDVPV